MTSRRPSVGPGDTGVRGGVAARRIRDSLGQRTAVTSPERPIPCPAGRGVRRVRKNGINFFNAPELLSVIYESGIVARKKAGIFLVVGFLLMFLPLLFVTFLSLLLSVGAAPLMMNVMLWLHNVSN